MSSKRIPALVLLAFAAALAAPSLPAIQETPAQPQGQAPAKAPDKKAAEAAIPVQTLVSAPVFSFDPAGRRDPFKDLFAGKDVKEGKRVITGLADMEIADIVLMGIVKTPERYEAIVAFAEGFPLTLLEGQKLADGFVVSIDADKVVFRKTSEKGMPLAKPKDIIKEISPEEPAHD